MQVQHTSSWLELPDLRVLQVATVSDGTLVVVVEGVATGAGCPKCSSWTNRVHQRRQQWVDDLPYNDRPRRLLPRLAQLISWLLASGVPELKHLATTFLRWQRELANYHRYRISNSITEGLNNKIKVIKRQAYGFRSFENFRRKILLAA